MTSKDTDQLIATEDERKEVDVLSPVGAKEQEDIEDLRCPHAVIGECRNVRVPM